MSWIFPTTFPPTLTEVLGVTLTHFILLQTLRVYLATDENAKNWFTALLRSPTRIYLKPFMPCTLIADGAGL